MSDPTATTGDRRAVAEQRITCGPRQFRRDVYADVAKQADHVTGPADRNDRGGKSIFEQEQGAHHPGGEFADGGVAVGVGRARDRQGRGQLVRAVDEAE